MLSLATVPYTFRMERGEPIPTIGDAFSEILALQNVDTGEVIKWIDELKDDIHTLEERYLRWADSFDDLEKKVGLVYIWNIF